MGQVLQLPQLQSDLRGLRSKNKVVFTNGCFDLLHIGHVRYLKEAKSLGDKLIVGLNADESVRRLKGETRPLQSQEDRAEILTHLTSVDYVVIFAEETPLNLILAIEPDVLVKGGDWPLDQIVGARQVMQRGGEVKTLQFVDARSTTKIVEKIQSE